MQKMMKYGFIFFLLACVLLSCEKEMSSAQADSFIKFYGSYLMDEAGEVEVLGNGGYALCGTETSESFGKRMVLIVTDEYGNIESGFPKYYAEEGLETGGSSLIALQEGSGGYVLSGYIERPVTGSQQMQKDIFVVKTTARGDTSWQRSYGSLEDEQVLHSIEMISSGYMLAGYQVKGGNSDLMVMGLTEEGDSLRLGLNYNNPYAENSSANYLLNAGDMYLCVCTYDKKNGEGTGIQVLTFNDALSPLVKYLSGEFDEYGMSILDEGDGHFLVLGNRESESGEIQLLLYGLETNGLLITNTSLNATISEQSVDLIGERIIETATGDLAITGTRTSVDNSEIFLQFVTGTYQAEELVSLGASGVQMGKDIELAVDGGFVMLGTNNVGGGSVLSLLKTSSSGEI